MHNTPTPDELLEVVARYLTEVAMPLLPPAAAFHARVAATALQVVRRQIALAPAQEAAERERLREDVAALRLSLDHLRLDTTHRLERAGRGQAGGVGLAAGREAQARPGRGPGGAGVVGGRGGGGEADEQLGAQGAEADRRRAQQGLGLAQAGAREQVGGALVGIAGVGGVIFGPGA
jgi:hypothetical protein